MATEPRAALCLFGQMRTYEQCYPLLKENVLEIVDPDIFIHTWEKPGGTWKKEYDDPSDGLVTEQALKSMYAHEAAVIEQFDDQYYERLGDIRMPEKVKELPNLQRGMIPMFYKMRQCTVLKRKKEEHLGNSYDLTILVRPDLAIDDPIPSKVIDNPNVLWNGGGSQYRIDDQFLISSSENIDYLTTIWDCLNEYWDTELHGVYGDLGVPKGYNVDEDVHIGIPERLIHYHMKQSRIDTRSHGVGTRIIRRDNTVRQLKDPSLRQLPALLQSGMGSLRRNGVSTTIRKGIQLIRDK